MVFGSKECHRRCDGKPIRLWFWTRKGTFSAGLRRWSWAGKADHSRKNFVFTLKNPHNIPARRFPLRDEKKCQSIYCESSLLWRSCFR
jgi:hypothetical protein